MLLNKFDELKETQRIVADQPLDAPEMYAEKDNGVNNIKYNK